MSSPNNSLQERVAEIVSIATAREVVRTLDDLIIKEASTKRFVKSRAARIERWQQLAECANRQASGLQVLAKIAPRRAAKRPSAPGTGVPITRIDETAAQQSA